MPKIIPEARIKVVAETKIERWTFVAQGSQPGTGVPATSAEGLLGVASNAGAEPGEEVELVVEGPCYVEVSGSIPRSVHVTVDHVGRAIRAPNGMHDTTAVGIAHSDPDPGQLLSLSLFAPAYRRARAAGAG